MWVMNNMFGTGGRDFAVITVVIPVTTYALVFNLLHPTTQRGIEDGIKKAILIWPGLFWHMLWDGIKKVTTWFGHLRCKILDGTKKAVTWVLHLWRKLWNGKQETPQV
jgi:hypothetical protein